MEIVHIDSFKCKVTKIELVPNIYGTNLAFHKRVIDKILPPSKTCDRTEYYPRIEPIKIQKIDMMYEYNSVIKGK